MIYVHGIERSLHDSLQFHLHLIKAIKNSCSLAVRQLKSFSTQIKSIYILWLKQSCGIFGNVLPIPFRGELISLKF